MRSQQLVLHRQDGIDAPGSAYFLGSLGSEQRKQDRMQHILGTVRGSSIPQRWQEQL